MNRRTVLISLWLLAFVGCKTTEPKNNIEAPHLDENMGLMHESVDDGATTLDEATKKIRGADAEILKGTKSINVKAPNLMPVTERIDAGVKVIEEQANRIDIVRNGLIDVKANMRTARGDIDILRDSVSQLQEQLAERDERIEELSGSLQASIQRTMLYMLLAGFAMVAICALMVYSGKPNGFMWGVAGAVIIVLSLTISFYMTKLAFVGAFALVVALAIVAYKIYEQVQERTARKEVVKTVEHLKPYVNAEHKEKEFGGTVDDGVVGTIQSDATKKIVARDREELGYANNQRTT